MYSIWYFYFLVLYNIISGNNSGKKVIAIKDMQVYIFIMIPLQIGSIFNAITKYFYGFLLQNGSIFNVITRYFYAYFLQLILYLHI